MTTLLAKTLNRMKTSSALEEIRRHYNNNDFPQAVIEFTLAYRSSGTYDQLWLTRHCLGEFSHATFRKLLHKELYNGTNI